MPVAEPSMSRYGWNAPAIEVSDGSRTRVSFDAETGICAPALDELLLTPMS